jgi:hypothetical protein
MIIVVSYSRHGAAWFPNLAIERQLIGVNGAVEKLYPLEMSNLETGHR